jgi:uncharacterized protein (DUF305 family)
VTDAPSDSPEAAAVRRVWWPAALGAVLALCLALGAALLYMNRDGSSSPGADSPEAGFARDMAVHHQQAVEMSFIVRDRTDDEGVRSLAYDIINTQANQRGMMLAWLDQWDLPKTSGESPMAWMSHEHDGMDMHSTFKPHDGALMPGMATNKQLDELRKANGKAAEVLYLQLMTAHHMGGVEMAQGAVDLAKDEHVKRLAQGMVDAQESEIKLMRDMLKERGATP